MKTARDFLTLDLCIAGDAESLTNDVKRVEARDREVRAAALRAAAEYLEALTVRAARTSDASVFLREMAERAERGE